MDSSCVCTLLQTGRSTRHWKVSVPFPSYRQGDRQDIGEKQTHILYTVLCENLCLFGCIFFVFCGKYWLDLICNCVFISLYSLYFFIEFFFEVTFDQVFFFKCAKAFARHCSNRLRFCLQICYSTHVHVFREITWNGVITFYFAYAFIQSDICISRSLEKNDTMPNIQMQIQYKYKYC